MMYTITRGPSKLVTQRRTGPTQQIESKFAELKLKPTTWLTTNSPAPKIVFNRLNGKRYHAASTQKSDGPAEGFTPAHEENVRFVYEAAIKLSEQSCGDVVAVVPPSTRLQRSNKQKPRTDFLLFHGRRWSRSWGTWRNQLAPRGPFSTPRRPPVLR
ncbi:MAPK regulated corepressor interacting protein 2 isoform 1-T1 [Aulostomus maculatus]